VATLTPEVGDIVRVLARGGPIIGRVEGILRDGRLVLVQIVDRRGERVIVRPELVDMTIPRKKEG
jgi:hypothetical protein